MSKPPAIPGMTLPNYEQLLGLITLWMDARPIGLAAMRELRAVPDALLATITSSEPYRQQAITDAQTYLALPKLVGIGLRYEIVEPVTIAPFEQWAAAISPLTIRCRWSRTMDSDFTDYTDERLHCVAIENDRWKIMSLWDDLVRNESLLFLAQLRRLK